MFINYIFDYNELTTTIKLIVINKRSYYCYSTLWKSLLDITIISFSLKRDLISNILEIRKISNMFFFKIAIKKYIQVPLNISKTNNRCCLYVKLLNLINLNISYHISSNMTTKMMIIILKASNIRTSSTDLKYNYDDWLFVVIRLLF